MSKPSISTRGETRIPMMALRISQRTNAAVKVKSPTQKTPWIWAQRSFPPPLKKRPLPTLELIAASEKRPTAKVPQIPFTKCTERAPTGSSILILSKDRTEKTTKTPAIAPIVIELKGLTKAQGAVIATRPAKAPLIVMDKSGFPIKSHREKLTFRPPAAAAILVVTAIWGMAPGSAAMVLPGLKPNQPSHRINPPKVALVML